MSRHVKRVAVWMFLLSGAALADSAADILLQTTGQQNTQTQNSSKVAQEPSRLQNNYSAFKLTDAFLSQFYSEWQVTGNALPYEVGQWATWILEGNFEKAAHLWSSLQLKINGTAFEVPARAAYVYSLWKLKLSQTFLDAWTAELSRPSFQNSRVGFALEQTFGTQVAAWLIEEHVILTDDQKETVQKLDPSKSQVFATLKAFLFLRKGLAGEDILKFLGPEHLLKMRLAETVAFAYAKQKNIAASAKVLKEHFEPSLAFEKSSEKRAKYYLEIARLLYQLGSIDGAESFYEKIPSGSDNFLTAREELAWVWLRQGKIDKLRGSLESLSGKLFKDRFAPEVSVVRSVSSLKLCYLDQVEKMLQDFVVEHEAWAKTIENALSAGDSVRPNEIDRYVQYTDNAIEKRKTEQARIIELAHASVQAALPAVGPQSHWLKAEDRLSSVLVNLQKNRQAEYRRIWKNRQFVLAESIKKMKFVKIEFLTQLQRLERLRPDPMKEITPVSEQVRAKSLTEKWKLNDDAAMTFPYDGVVWADEILKLRSVSQMNQICKEARR